MKAPKVIFGTVHPKNSLLIFLEMRKAAFGKHSRHVRGILQTQKKNQQSILCKGCTSSHRTFANERMLEKCHKEVNE